MTRAAGSTQTVALQLAAFMPGFVWVKTQQGTRTAGFFAFQASEGQVFTSDGTQLELPPGCVVVHNEELMTMINKSTPKGIYVSAWEETRDKWSQYLRGISLTINGSILCRPDYFMLNNAITAITEMAGIPTPRNRSKDVVAEKKADAMANKNKIELDYKDKIETSLQILKPKTVRAGTLDPPGRLTASSQPVLRRPAPSCRAQSASVHRFYRKATDELNMHFMVQNRLTKIIFPTIEKIDQVVQISPEDDEWTEYIKLCTKLNIAPPTQMQTEMCQHFMIIKNNKIMAGMSVMTANINYSNR